MAHSVRFSIDLPEPKEPSRTHILCTPDFSPYDENVVHDSFSHLIQEQSQSLMEGNLDAIEMEELDNRQDSHTFLAHSTSRDNVEEDIEKGAMVICDHFSDATLRVLSSMPSRTIGRCRGAIISQYCNRTLKLRRRRSRPSINGMARCSRPSIRPYGVEKDPEGQDEEEKRNLLINNLRNLPINDRNHMLRTIPLSLTEKRSLRYMAFKNKNDSGYSLKQLPCCSQLKYNLIIVFRQIWYTFLSFLHSLQLWHVALKKVSGRFGTGVLSYFLFLKMLFFFNIFLLFINMAFLVIPQSLCSQGSVNQFQGLELLTGAGSFTNTVMYYGYYTNSTLNENTKSSENRSLCIPYNMPLAYFFTIGISYFITCIILMYSMSRSFEKSYRVDNPHGDLAMKVFCSWDFKVIKKVSVKLQMENTSTQLKELLSELSRPSCSKSLCQKLMKMAVHTLAWTISLGSTFGCALAVHYFSAYMSKNLSKNVQQTTQIKEASLLALPVVVSAFNLLMPCLYNAVAWIEQYELPSMATYIAIFRNLLLKLFILGILCYHWLGTTVDGHNILKPLCWETFVGQELYRFLLMDFIFTILDTIFGEFVWRIFSQKVLGRQRKPVFDIARNVLELIYGQTLAWLGVLFSPLIPAVQIIKLVLLFYIKKTSLMMNCQSPSKPWRASQMMTIFITLLCFPSFLGSAVVVTYTIWSIRPSNICGPFRSLNTIFESGKIWMRKLETENANLAWFTWIHTYMVENPFFLFFIAGILLIIIYFYAQVADGQRSIISLLQEQIDNEGKDKKFLIGQLQEIYARKRPVFGKNGKDN
ncbi:transmembrane channel-like protein 6b [Erpetoichthys calabaricus]|uniref:transmembrane channel-like protein 6b n=1 Tax=Erpetoichthys calabaricus TaxID=27687 RepID=UPI002234D6B9|nr:transmembrane channel-like protein 6b [Erpetoichthys calabaricus]XP_028675010.2 transmembrane channel-like protein 6b [Erpetoichthys calabaricus]XP_051792198.1 transmembrane channel-like protein 6b [Erpetoichthys calabaricus]